MLRKIIHKAKTNYCKRDIQNIGNRPKHTRLFVKSIQDNNSKINAINMDGKTLHDNFSISQNFNNIFSVIVNLADKIRRTDKNYPEKPVNNSIYCSEVEENEVNIKVRESKKASGTDNISNIELIS